MPRKDEYKPGDRFSADMDPVFPKKDKLACKDCALRKRGILGEMNSYCDAYTEMPGKPREILFDAADCEYYKKET